MDASDNDSQAELISEYYASNLIFNYSNLAVFVVIVFEYIITFDREVRFFWGRKLSRARTVFLLNRYLSILEYLVALGPLLPVVNLLVSSIWVYGDAVIALTTPHSCVFLIRLMQANQIALYAVWAAFSGVRVFAISARSWYVTSAVVVLAVVPVVTNSYVATMTPVALTPDIGCMTSMTISTATWIQVALVSVATRSCMIVSDVIVIIVTWIKTWSTIRAAERLQVRIRMSFTSLVLKEGILYFGITLSLNVLQIIFDFVELGSYSLMLLFLNVFTPVLISRFYLDLDDLTVYDTDPLTCEMNLPTLRFV